MQIHNLLKIVFQLILILQEERSPTENDEEFVLALCLRVPPSSGFLAYYIHSPVVVIDKFIGEEGDVNAPQWVQSRRLEYKFWQQRSLMLDLLLYFAADMAEDDRLRSKVETLVQGCFSE